MLSLSAREFSYVQTFMNEMYQSAALRDGPSGGMVVSIRHKFLIQGPVDLNDTESRFLLFALQDVSQSSRSPIVTSQMGNSMRFVGGTERKVQSSINQDPSEMSGTYLTEWDVIQSIMTKLGLAAPPPYTPLVEGPDGDADGIATPMHHDINDGTGYNHR